MIKFDSEFLYFKINWEEGGKNGLLGEGGANGLGWQPEEGWGEWEAGPGGRERLRGPKKAQGQRDILICFPFILIG